MSSPLPFLRPAFEDLPAVPSMAGVAASAEQGAAGDSQPSGGEDGRVLEVSKPVHVSAPTSSFSNGETPVHTSDNRGDLTVDASELGESHHLQRRQDYGKTSIELSALPERPVLRVVAGDGSGRAALDAGSVHRQEHGGSETGSPMTSPVQGVWTQHVYTQPTSAGRGNSVAVLSDAAALMIAHAVHRSSLLQQCFTQWQVQQARHAQQRFRSECFAEGYYQRNLVYLFFRAWQWRYDRRTKCAQQRRMLEALRARHLRHRALVTWQRWKNARRRLWGRLDEMQARTRTALTRECFEWWHRTSTHRALARAAAQASADNLRDARFRQWQRFALQRKGGRLFVSVLMLHTPVAWTAAQQSRCDELHLRYAWIQWLRVAMQRRACQLLTYESVLSTVTMRTEQALRQRWYVWWLQVTCVSLQSRHTRRGLLQRYYKRWTLLGRLRLIRLHWERETSSPHLQRRCLAHWRGRLGGRQASREHLRMAELFFESVVRAHAVRAAFHCWRDRHSRRAKAQRMRRVAEGYARPALLRHLFLRHVTDGVLASPTGLADALEYEAWRRGADAKVVKPKISVIASNENSTLDVSAKTSGASSTCLRPPIPLRHHRHAPTGGLSVPVASPEAPLEPDRRSYPSEAAGTARSIAASAPEHAADMEVLLPPPPSYEEVMSSWRSTDTSGRIGACALPVRVDAGVGTNCESPTPLQRATPRVSSEGDRSAARPDVAHQREEAAPPPVSTVPGRGMSPAGAPNVWPAAVPCYAVPNGAPVSWTLELVPTRSGWRTVDTLVPPSGSVTPSASAVPSYHSVHCAPPTSYVVPAAVESPSCAAFRRFCAEGAAQPSGVEYGPRAPAALPSPAIPLQSEGVFPASPSPPTHYGFDIHRHVDPLAPLTHSSSSAPRAEDPGCVDSPDPRAHRGHRARRRCDGPPAMTLGNAILSQGRMPLSFAGRCQRGKKHAGVLSPERKARRGVQSAHTTLLSSSSSSSRSSSTSAAPQTSDAALFPLCLPSSTGDSSALRARARDALGDYKRRTRLIAAEKAELATIEAQLALAPPTKDMAHKRELSKRRRYLQRRLLEWEQRRAQIAQLAVWLEGCVSAATSAAVSQRGVGEL
ncbi:conserved hypothetical protein [Leishmania mexicana MHOM/GT/2001/U1103]|uniref:Sfi1 spindle body domain-containing protein n=1 Tax=Leishmania mexicana (strain MHOM/GT/2001/U1103) TaxID=929439 RepID=E9B1R2_LEIMU|nr:conserved hypothetical protein [Leishmania mexicana MHOM/GT/2001/U1103]CBZ29169.1 conserved hypothetical protein [Leishmania mexicana MHOM/GT/2001/U1103]